MRMALVLSVNNYYYLHTEPSSLHLPFLNPNSSSLKFPAIPKHPPIFYNSFESAHRHCRRNLSIVRGLDEDEDSSTLQEEEEVDNLGVKAALSMLRFYKREISPLMPNSCRYVPTCSEYSMIAYKKYGVAKGTILTAWRLCRCNPLGGSGFDPPRWFDEASPSDQ